MGHQQEMAYGESNGHVTQNGQGRTRDPNMFAAHYLENVGGTRSVITSRDPEALILII